MADYAIVATMALIGLAAALHTQGHAILAALGLEQRPAPAEAEPMRTLGALFPEEHARLAAIEDPAARSRALGQWLSAQAPVIASAPDAEILALDGLHLRLLHAARAVNPVVCAELVTGGPDATVGDRRLPPIAAALSRAYAAAEITAASAAAAAASSPKPSLRLSARDARALDRRLLIGGDPRALLIVRKPAGESPVDVCHAGVVLAEAMQKLPPAQAARIGRSVLGDVWKLPD